MLAAADLATAVSLAESLMVDSCTIRLPSTRGPFNESTGQYAVTPGAVVYQGKCKRVAAGTMPVISESGDRDVTQVRSEIRIPVASDHVPVGAIVTLDACPHDPSSAGSKYRVTGHVDRTWPKDIRLNVTEVEGD